MTESMATKDEGGSAMPKDWWRAPKEWGQRNPADFWIFVLVNLFFGTLALWLPMVNAGLGGHSTMWCELEKLLETGALYMYAIPFLAAVVGVAFASLVPGGSAEQARGTKIVLIFTAIGAFVLAMIFLQIQILGPDPSHRDLNFGVQVVFSIFLVVLGLYFQAIIQNEAAGTPQGDMEENARKLQERANNAKTTKKDFA